MKKVLLICLLLVLGVVGYFWYQFSRTGGGDKGPKQQPVALKKHSVAFNSSVTTAMNAYFDMKAAFVEADTLKVKENARKFISLVDSIPLAELKSDTASIFETAQAHHSDIKANAQSILVQTDITEMRKDFSMVSENLYPFFRVINYEGDPMYWQNCPMAFDDDKEANWISSTVEVINPYLGKNHPKYKAGMLHCGSILDTIKAK
jgi:Protein of unknown function (DUF3347)